ncbi:MAG TPA: helix-turn-helix domain-containing protein [Pilimelia sp.]|nr:helix-turn-helix domain-containing protein [Pilimelia sp.]
MDGTATWPRTRALINPRAGEARFRYAAIPPDDALAAFVAHYWMVTWDLDGQEPHRQQVMPHPRVNMTFMAGRCRVAGVVRGHFAELLSGTGRVVGVSFRPGGFRPLLGAPAATITDRFLPVADVFGALGAAACTAIVAAPDDEAVAELAGFLRRVVPDPDPTVDLVDGIVAAVAADPTVTRVSALAATAGLSARRLQRLFHEYVGVGPKWVVRRYRMHEAAARVADGEAVDWAELADALGYADQAHFTRDFTATVGLSPARYARECARSADEG